MPVFVFVIVIIVEASCRRVELVEGLVFERLVVGVGGGTRKEVLR